VLEDVDARIVAALAQDGRCSFTDLAERIGLSVSAVHQRVRRLERRGVITGYAATVAVEQLGLPMTAFVSLTPVDPAAPGDHPAVLAGFPEVEACYAVAGLESYIVKVRVASPSALEQLLGRIRAAVAVSTRTTMVLSTAFEHRQVVPVPDGPGVTGSVLDGSAVDGSATR
jgi:Lrp/AsnC family leucine-responsive transcriptional regulator